MAQCQNFRNTPRTPLTLPWYNFWTWYTSEFPATSYSDQARVAFEYLPTTTGNPNHWTSCIKHLIFSIRYFATPPPLNQIVSRIHTALVQSDLFDIALVNVEQTTTYQPPGDTSSSDESDPAQPLGFPRLQHNLDEHDNNDFEDDDFDIMEAAAPRIQAALESLVHSKPLQVKTFKGYGADPGEWLQDFEHAANKVRWQGPHKHENIRYYLGGEAKEWFDAEGPFDRWVPDENHPRPAEAFKPSFLNRFRTRGKVLQWHLELDQHVQKAGETVAQYGKALRKLLQRVDPNGEMNEHMRIHTFVRGLRPTIQTQMINYLTCRDQVTYSDVTAAAEQFERSQLAHLQAITGVTPVQATNIVAAVQPAVDPMDQLTKKLEAMLQPVVTAIGSLNQRMAANQPNVYRPPVQRNQQPQGNRPPPNQWQQRQPRGNLTCHRCGQPGHIARVCPNGLASQPPVQTQYAVNPQQYSFAASHEQPLYNTNHAYPTVSAPRPTQSFVQASAFAQQPWDGNRQPPPQRPSTPRYVNFCVDEEQAADESLNW